MHNTIRPLLLAATSAWALTASPSYAASAATDVTGWVQTNSVSLHYQLVGPRGKAGAHAPTLVLLHEIGLSMQSWDEVMPSLAANHRVLRYDMRGFGLSEKIRKVSFADEVADLKGLLEALHVEGPVVLVGAALGSTIAFEFAAENPERVAALIAISPTVRINPPARSPNDPGTNAGADVLDKDGVRAYLTPKQADTIYPPELRTNPDRLARFWGMEYANDPGSRAATLRMFDSTLGDATPMLGKVQCPTLVVGTELTRADRAGTEATDPIVKALPKGQAIVLNTGHLAAFASPELVAPAILNFLKQQKD